MEHFRTAILFYILHCGSGMITIITVHVQAFQSIRRHTQLIQYASSGATRTMTSMEVLEPEDLEEDEIHNHSACLVTVLIPILSRASYSIRNFLFSPFESPTQQFNRSTRCNAPVAGRSTFVVLVASAAVTSSDREYARRFVFSWFEHTIPLPE